MSSLPVHMPTQSATAELMPPRTYAAPHARVAYAANDHPLEPQGPGLQHYLNIWRRRKWQMIVPALVLLASALAAAMLLPATYRSIATILIEEQEIPPELVRTTVTGFADQRIQSISQQVMTRATLLKIVDKFGLYSKDRNREPTETLIERMRKDIKLDMISAEMMDRRSGAKSVATIAFTLSFDAARPDQAQQVANELVSLFLNENLSNRQRKSVEASDFLAEESKKLNERIADLEARLAKFKERNVGRLPELTQLNIQMRDRAEMELLDVERQQRGLEDRKFYLEGQLAQIKPNTPMISASGEKILDSEERLKALQAQYVSVASTYGADHPDVVKMRREIAALERDTGRSQALSNRSANELAKLRGELAALRDHYSDEHPDVIRLKRAVAAQEQKMRAEVASAIPEADLRTKNPENPAYITLRSQLDATLTDIKVQKRRQAELQSRVNGFNAKLAQAPEVERQYQDLARERDNEVKRYQELRAKQMDAQVAQELEKDRKGERFSLIDPPQLPEKAHKPNRLAIGALGSVLALGAGLGVGALRESLDRTVRGVAGMQRAVPLPLLAAIPYMRTTSEMRRRSLWRWAVALGILALLATGALGVHYFVMPLDAQWFVLQRKLGF